MGPVHYILEDFGTTPTELLLKFCYMQQGTCREDEPKLVGVFIV